MSEERARRALEDVVAIKRLAPGLVQVVTWSDAYTVDAREGDRCTCADRQYNLESGEPCKHELAARLATSDLPAPWEVEPDLSGTADQINEEVVPG